MKHFYAITILTVLPILTVWCLPADPKDALDTISAHTQSLHRRVRLPLGTSAWESAQCTQPEITDATIDPTKRWDSVETESALNQAFFNAETTIMTGKNNGLSFSALISNYFHGKEEMHCENIVAHNGCNELFLCNDVNHPAGYFILNSFVSVSNMNNNIYTAVGAAGDAVTKRLGTFTSTFATFDDKSSALKTILDIVGVCFVLFASPIWNIALKESAFFANKANQLGTLKDAVNGIVASGITFAKDLSVAGSTLNAQNSLSDNLGGLIEIWGQMISNYNGLLFSGKPDGVSVLRKQITEGRMITGTFAIDQNTVSDYIQKALYGLLIPKAWSLSNNDIHPVILDSGNDCSSTSLPDYIDSKDKSAASHCISNKMYYLVSATGSSQIQTSGGSPFVTNAQSPFQALPGLSSIDGKNWGGLNLEDLVAGSLATYSANGDKNGGTAIDPSSQDALTDIYNNGLRAAGIFRIPVCGVQEAQAGWATGDKSGNYPCH